MIVGIAGTSGSFPRLIEALAYCKAERPEQSIWVQHCGTPLPPGIDGVALTSRATLLEKVRQAEAVVCHAGSGTLFDVLSCGHVPVVMARRHAYREHVNDHQLEIASALARAGRVIELTDASHILEALDEAVARRGEGSVGAGRELIEALRDELRKPVKTHGRRASLFRWISVKPYPR